MSDVPALADAMAPVDEGFDRVAPEHVSAVVLHLASPACAFTGRVSGAEGDDLYAFQGFTAATHPNNGRQQWTLEGLATALADVDRQDRGYAVAPSSRYVQPQPSDEALAALGAVG